VIASFPAAVPPDMRNVAYKPFNLAHQLKQGTKYANPPCSMIGHGRDHEADTGRWQFFQLESELFFGCEVAYSSWSHARKYNSEMELSEVVEQWRETWRIRGLAGRKVLIPEDVICAYCSAEREDMSSRGRIFLN